MLRYVKFVAWVFVTISALSIATRPDRAVGAPTSSPAPPSPPVTPGGSAGWFARAKPFCNSVEVVTHVSQDPPPAEATAQGYGAACYALAGRIDSARALIQRLQPSERVQAAGIVFEVGHPVADMGDDKSAGPIMELVVEYQPDNYMALYHAGASEFQLGQLGAARTHLEGFLRTYGANDGWTSSARGMLDRIARTAPAQLEAPEDARR